MFALEADLVLAVQSLYSDGLRPYGRLVRKRLGEIASERGEAFNDGDLGRLRRFCELSRCLMVEPGEGSEWSVVLPDQHADFVDVYSTNDVYSIAVWEALSQHLCMLESRGESLPGGRYSCAKALMAAGLPAFSGLSLGEACHVVQLAMSQKKLLGYLDGTIAPYSRSSSRMKDTAAELCMGSSASQQLPLASASEARSCMIDVLESAVRKGKTHVPISTLKRLFRSRFHKELSETALGHTKLSDLLQDNHFKDFCSVRLLERGYVVIPHHTFSAAQARSVHIFTPLLVSVTLPTLSVSAQITTTCKNTFIHAPEPQPSAQVRSKSVPKDLGSCKMRWEEVDDSDESTNVGSGVQSPAVTASPCWTPRDSFERTWRCQTQADCNYYNSCTGRTQMCAWADVPLDGSCTGPCDHHWEHALCASMSSSIGSHYVGPCESSDPSNRCVLCLSHFI